MAHRLIYLVGAPGSGKSTLLAKMTEHLDRTPVTDAPVAHDVLRFKYFDSAEDAQSEVIEGAIDTIAGAEIGVHREKFGGTDALPASIIEKAIPWVESKPYELLLAEGARLANKRFLTAAAKAGYKVHLGFLDHPAAAQWLAERNTEIGHIQNASWVKGRYTASLNLVKHFAENPKLGVKVYIGHPDVLLADMEHLLG